MGVTNTHIVTPTFSGGAIRLIALVVIILVAENIGHIRAISSFSSFSIR